MPAHLHPGPPCQDRQGRYGCAPNVTCRHSSCLNGGALLDCFPNGDGRYYCFHSGYVGADRLPDAYKPAALAQRSRPTTRTVTAGPTRVPTTNQSQLDVWRRSGFAPSSTNPVPDEGEWLLVASNGQPIPPFVKLWVYFDYGTGFVQGMNVSRFGSLSKVTPIAANKFGAFFRIGGVRGQFEATLCDSGDLIMEFLSPQRSTQIAHPIMLNRDAVVQANGVFAARQMVAQFAARSGRGAFPNIAREELVVSLLRRIDQPEAINQGNTNTCGPAAFMFTFAKHDIAAYTKFVIDLYERGEATVGNLRVRPSESFRSDPMPRHLVDSPADWIALGSLRDSANWFFQYHTNSLPFVPFKTQSDNPKITWEGVRGGTTTGEVKSWLKNMGYTEVVDESSVVLTSSLDNLRDADRRYRNGEKVCLMICANVLSSKQDEAAGGGACDHFVVLASPIEIGRFVQFKMFTWGGFQTLHCRLTPEEFVKSYYGYVAARR
jgi:hypothetical protein